MIVALITYFYWNIILKGNIIRKMAFSGYKIDIEKSESGNILLVQLSTYEIYFQYILIGILFLLEQVCVCVCVLSTHAKYYYY
jgi:hypothetical protein